MRDENVFPNSKIFLGYEVKAIEENWQLLRSIKFKTENQLYKPYNLMEFKLKRVMDENCANLFDQSHIFQKLILDHSFMLSFAYPIPDPNSALLVKVIGLHSLIYLF